MGTELNFGSSVSRRGFLKGSAFVVGAGALSLEAFIAACNSTATSTSAATATVNSLPPSSNPGALYVFNQQVKQFEQAYSNEKIVGKNDPYDPTTYFARLAAGQQEDGVQSYFTEPPLLISKHAAADITSLAKGWRYFSDYAPSIASIVTDSAGKIYGIPTNGYTLGILFNRNMFKAAGLDPDKPPTTWADFRAAAKALTSSSVFGFAETRAAGTSPTGCTRRAAICNPLMERRRLSTATRASACCSCSKTCASRTTPLRRHRVTPRTRRFNCWLPTRSRWL
jgi:maltose-binding protein MalE